MVTAVSKFLPLLFFTRFAPGFAQNMCISKYEADALKCSASNCFSRMVFCSGKWQCTGLCTWDVHKGIIWAASFRISVKPLLRRTLVRLNNMATV